MTEIEGQEILSEESDEQGEFAGVKLVPVGESIRYRKRAQSAEKKAEELSEQLTCARQQVSEMSGRLRSIELEQRLAHKLAAAGAIDLEAAVTIARNMIEQEGDGNAAAAEKIDLNGFVERMKGEKRYLFGGGSSITGGRTASAKDRAGSSNFSALERAAKKASQTGSRTDLQEYLRLRKNFV
jgi:hypothetical protein